MTCTYGNEISVCISVVINIILVIVNISNVLAVLAHNNSAKQQQSKNNQYNDYAS